MASFADYQSAWQQQAAPPPPAPPASDDDTPSPSPELTVTPRAPVAKAPASFDDIMKAWSDTSPAPAGFKDDNGPTFAQSAKDAAIQLPAGIAEGAPVAAGMPGDLQSMNNTFMDKVSNHAIHALLRFTGQINTPADEANFWKLAGAMQPGDKGLVAQAAAAAGAPAIGATSLPTSQQTSTAFQDITGLLPDPTTPAGRYARTIGNMVPLAAMGGEGLLARGAMSAARTVGADIVAPAVGSQAATDATDDPALKPLAGFLGGAGTAGLAHGTAAGVGKAVDTVANSPMVAKAVASTPGLGGIGQGMQENIAARHLTGAVQDLPTFAQNLEPKPGGDSAIPGFKPTTYQLTGDPGVGQLELHARQGEGRAQQFVARQDEQKAAQATAAQSMMTPGDPSAVPAMVQSHMDAIDAAADEQHQAARAAAQQQTDAIGTGETPDAIGANLRQHLDDAESRSAQRYGDLYKVVNPDGSLGADTAGLQQAAAKIYSAPNLSETAQAFIDPVEKKYIDLIQGYKPTVGFNEVVDLKKQLASSLRAAQATGDKPLAARLTGLIGATYDAISGAVKDRATQEAQAVSAGQMAPEDTMDARVASYLQNQVDSFYANRQSGLASGTEGYGAYTGGRSVGSVSFSRTAGPTGRGFGGDASAQGISAPAYRLPTEADAAHLRAANAAFIDHQQTYNEGPLKPILAPGKRAGEFKSPDYAVPRQVLRNGPAGYRTVQAYLHGAGDTPEALESLKAAMADTLRSHVTSDGLLPADKLTSWRNRFAHALRAIDEASPGFSHHFDDVATASDAVLQAARAKVDQTNAFKASAAGKFLGASTDEAVIERVGKIITGDDGVANMRQLMQAASSDPAAAAGVRNAVGRWLSSQFTTEEKIGSTGDGAIGVRQFRRLFAQRAPILREVLTPEQLDVAGRIAETMDQAQRSVTGNRLGGGSDTAQKQVGQKLFKKENKALGHAADSGLMLSLIEGAQAGFEHGLHQGSFGKAVLYGAAGAAPAGAGYMLKALRTAGIHDVQGLVYDALMNPDRARQLLKRVSPNDFRERRLGGLVRQSFINEPDKDPGAGGAPPNQPPPTGPFSRGGATDLTPNSAKIMNEIMRDRGDAAFAQGSRITDARGRIEPMPPDVPGSRANAVTVSRPADLAPARARVDTAPTPAQAEAGNYRKGHAVVEGLPLSIENPRGSTRTGTGSDGKPWSARMPADYGYVKGTVGADGDHVDAYVGMRPSQGTAHVIDQVDPDTGKFDEHKVMLHAGTPEQAAALYKRGFSDGRGGERLGDMTTLPVDQLKEWLAQPQTKPMGEKLRATDATATVDRTKPLDVMSQALSGPQGRSTNRPRRADGHDSLLAASKSGTLDQYLKGFPEYSSSDNPLTLRQIIDGPADAHSLERTYNIDDMAGRSHGVVNTRYDPATKNVHILSMDATNLDRGLTRSHASDLIQDIKSDYPAAETISGMRITGARGAERADVRMSLKGVRPRYHPDAEATQQAIIAHEKRLHGARHAGD